MNRGVVELSESKELQSVNKISVDDRLLRKEEVAERYGLHPRSINRYVDRGDLPKPIYLDSKRRVPRWSRAQLQEWENKKRRENEQP
jgi:predicted DNA-binding transcriptional regulator AlpA